VDALVDQGPWLLPLLGFLDKRVRCHVVALAIRSRAAVVDADATSEIAVRARRSAMWRLARQRKADVAARDAAMEFCTFGQLLCPREYTSLRYI
jgi:hypothetical protein